MRIDADGHLIYANPASAPILRPIDASAGDPVPAETIVRFAAVAPGPGFVEFIADNRTYAVWPVPITDMNFTNLYGMDVTAERAIVKFPDQNPNPVFRIKSDGTLVYANPASAGLVHGLGLAAGTSLPARRAVDRGPFRGRRRHLGTIRRPPGPRRGRAWRSRSGSGSTAGRWWPE